MLKSLIHSGKGRGSQSGFTLIEFAVAMAISMLLIVGAAEILRYTVVQTGANSDRTMAQQETQYVSFWINQDVIQAQHIHFGNSTGTGFPLTITWIGQDGGNDTVTYGVVNNLNLSKNPWQLTRTEANRQGNVTSLVAQYLNPNLTDCYQKTEDNQTYNVLVLDVDAKVDQSEANSTFDISPRYSGITWH